MSFRDVQNLLDENTESIPEGLYLQLSKTLTEAHRARTREIEEALNRHAGATTRVVLARNGDELLNEIVELRGKVDLLREELFESNTRVSVLLDRVSTYKQQVTASSKKNEEYKKKIKELEVVLSLKEQGRIKEVKQEVVEPKENPWCVHVRKWSEAHGVKYGQALKLSECKEDYRRTR